ncbi:restriction endonuclease, SacI family [Rothia nasimurium]|uniref:restriction endonuclease, SacI family n=1 Tax=Rothia nasimurium TaxID=85336 RepID=UPI001F4539E8|nr:restriction endonuclease, SacI family [Rothia nasimurium]
MIDYNKAEELLHKAYNLALEGKYSEQWIINITTIWSFSAKTYTPALGTILLAKSVNKDIDVFSIKKNKQNKKSYSLRSLCHRTLVPISNELNFSIRNTGREPLNNQPFFRYDRIDEISRVRDSQELDVFQNLLHDKISKLDEEQALIALSSFIKIGMVERANSLALQNLELSLTSTNLIDSIKELYKLDNAGPWVTQALGATFLEFFGDNIATRRLNDPSRDFPGDVQCIVDNAPLISLEARNKRITESDATVFIESCARAGIKKAILLEITNNPTNLDKNNLPLRFWDNYLVSTLIIDSVEELYSLSLNFGFHTRSNHAEVFANNLTRNLTSIEAPPSILNQWITQINPNYESLDLTS